MFNGAEGPIADAIRLLQAPGFEQGLWHVLHRVAAPDNLAILIYRHAGAPEVLYTQTERPQVFAEFRSEDSGRGKSARDASEGRLERLAAR